MPYKLTSRGRDRANTGDTSQSESAHTQRLAHIERVLQERYHEDIMLYEVASSAIQVAGAPENAMVREGIVDEVARYMTGYSVSFGSFPASGH
jgi:hypothetical protein